MLSHDQVMIFVLSNKTGHISFYVLILLLSLVKRNNYYMQ